MYALRYAAASLTTIAVIAVGAAFLLSSQPTEVIRHEEEWVKALLQAGLIAVLGAVTSAVLETFKDGLQRVRDRSKVRFDVLADVGRIYMDTKLIRRRAKSAKKAIAPDDLPELNELQVRLELHKYNSPALFRDEAALQLSLERMETYLNDVANKPNSNERRAFVEEGGLLQFSTAFHQAMTVMQQDLGSYDRNFTKTATKSSAPSGA